MNTCTNHGRCKKCCTKKMLILAGIAILGFCAFTQVTRTNAMEAMDHDAMEHGAMMSMEQGGIVPYEKTAFETDLAAGKPIALVFYKEGCPTCIKQEPHIEKSAMVHGVTVYRVNYVNDKETVKKYKVGIQSTLIVFKNGEAVSTTAGVTDANELDAAIGMAL